MVTEPVTKPFAGTPEVRDEILELVNKTLFKGPCKCCGDLDHGVFDWITGKGGRPRVTLACAASEKEDWESVLKSGLDSMRFKASFEKFSEANDNDLGRVQVSMRHFIKNGEGKHMNYLELIDFDSDLHRYRKAMGNQGRFKRDIGRYDEEEISQESDDEPRC